jgi:hypothetical protein
MARKAKRTYGVRRGSRKVGKRIDWFWEAYWTEDGRDVSRRFSENAYGEGIAERKAREARLAAQEPWPILRERARSLQDRRGIISYNLHESCL